jgi:hypothetical protein
MPEKKETDPFRLAEQLLKPKVTEEKKKEAPPG